MPLQATRKRNRAPPKPRAEPSSFANQTSPANPIWESLALHPPILQSKLAIGRPDDPDERDADRAADSLVPMAPLQTPVGRFESDALQQIPPAPKGAGPRATSIGSSEELSTEQREYFEPRLHTSLAAVLIQDDEAAHATAASLNARAWTLGADVFSRVITMRRTRLQVSACCRTNWPMLRCMRSSR